MRATNAFGPWKSPGDPLGDAQGSERGAWGYPGGPRRYCVNPVWILITPGTVLGFESHMPGVPPDSLGSPWGSRRGSRRYPEGPGRSLAPREPLRGVLAVPRGDGGIPGGSHGDHWDPGRPPRDPWGSLRDPEASLSPREYERAAYLQRFVKKSERC